MLMTKDELDIEETMFSSTINVYCTFAAYNKTWPDVLEHNGKLYKFNGQMPIPRHNAGIFAGHAEYVLA